MVKFRALEALSLKEKSLVENEWWFGNEDQILEVLNSNFCKVWLRVGSPNQISIQISVYGKNTQK